MGLTFLRFLTRQKWVVVALSSAVFLFFHSRGTAPTPFLTVTTPMIIRINRDVPPRAAFDDLSLPPFVDNEWEEIEKIPSTNLNLSVRSPKGNLIHARLRSQKQIVLEPMSFFRQEVFDLVRLRGKIRLAPGLALGDRPLEVRRYVEGIPLESGRIDLETGNFFIEPSDFRGTLSVELFDHEGVVVASGEHQISVQDRNKQIEIEVSIKKQLGGHFVDFNRDPTRLVAQKLVSSRGEPSEIYYASLGLFDQTDSLGSFTFPRVSESSFALIRARSKKFGESLTVLGAGETQGISLMPQRLLSSLKQIVSDFRHEDLSKASLVWGQALFNGKPVSGVTVSVERNSNIKPVYLKGFIPQNDLVATTENGYFLFFNLNPGLHSVIASKDRSYFGHLNVVVDEEAISAGNIESTVKNHLATVKALDAFDGSFQAVSVRLQGVSSALSVLGQSEIFFKNIHRLSYGYIKPNNDAYLAYQFSYDEREDYLHLPLLKKEWMYDLIKSKNVSITPDGGLVVGLVPSDDFDVYLPHEENYKQENIIYFDKLGRETKQGSAGGGFILLNVPAGGVQSVVVLSKKTGIVSSSVIPVDPGSTTINKFKF